MLNNQKLNGNPSESTVNTSTSAKKPNAHQNEQRKMSNQKKSVHNSTTTIGKMLNNDAHSQMLDAFWKLSQFNHAIRVQGINQIMEYYAKLNVDQDEESSNYVLTRLVKGLASNRKCSRLGFSCALTELFRKFHSIRFETVLQIAKQHLKCSSTDQEHSSTLSFKFDKNILSKEEMRHMQIGTAFVYVCWLQSDRLLFDDQLSVVKQIGADLNQFRKSKEVKNYIQQLYLQALISLIKKISNASVFNAHILPILADDLKSLFNNQTSDTLNKDNLNILLSCLNTYEKETLNLLKSNKLSLDSVLNEANLDTFYELISQSSEYLPNLQPICVELLTYLLTSTSSKHLSLFKKLWLHQIDAKLFNRKELEKKYLGFRLFLFALSHLNEQNVDQLFDECLFLSENLFQTFMNNYSNRFTNLNPLCKEIGKEMAVLIKTKESIMKSKSIGAKLIIKFMQVSKRFHDSSELIGSLSAHLNETSVKQFFHFLINDWMRKDALELCTNQSKLQQSITNPNLNKEDASTEMQLSEEHFVNKQFWTIGQIGNLCKNASLFEHNALIEMILFYLSVQTYFHVTNNQTKTFNKYEIGISLDNKKEKIKNSLVESLLEFTGTLISKNDTKQVEILINLIKSLNDLLSEDETKSKNGIKLVESLAKKRTDLQAISSRILKLLQQIHKAMTNVESTSPDGQFIKDTLQTFFIIITVEFFRMFDSTKNSKQVIDDIEICYKEFADDIQVSDKTKKAAGKKNSSQQQNDFKWIDVLVEMLLNLFTINKSWIRNAAKARFRKLFPKLTVQSVQLIVDLLEPENKEDFADEDEEEEEELNDEDEEEGDEKEEANDDESDESSDDDDEEEEEIDEKEVEENKNRVKKLNGLISNGLEKNDETNNKALEVNEFSSSMLIDTNINDDDQEMNDANPDDDNDDEDDDDLNDEEMMKMDNALAEAFKMRRKDKNMESNMLQYKLRALDFIEEIIKSPARLDLVTYLITPLLNILFETQTKPNLKLISQRILNYMLNLKNTTKKMNEAKLPSTNDLFEVLSFVITCSATHFNVLNTLVESSMFCVRLIHHIASTQPKESAKILDQLTNVYLEIIKNDKSKVNPIMYKEYMIRYPSNSLKLATQMLEIILANDVKLHKKTVTIINLYQSLNSQMLIGSDSTSVTAFAEKLSKFFENTIGELTNDQSLNIKFVDAFLNLMNRSLNLKDLFKKQFKESFASKLTLFTKESKVKQAYKSRLLNLIQICMK